MLMEEFGIDLIGKSHNQERDVYIIWRHKGNETTVVGVITIKR